MDCDLVSERTPYRDRYPATHCPSAHLPRSRVCRVRDRRGLDPVLLLVALLPPAPVLLGVGAGMACSPAPLPTPPSLPLPLRLLRRLHALPLAVLCLALATGSDSLRTSHAQTVLQPIVRGAFVADNQAVLATNFAFPSSLLVQAVLQDAANPTRWFVAWVNTTNWQGTITTVPVTLACWDSVTQVISGNVTIASQATEAAGSVRLAQDAVTRQVYFATSNAEVFDPQQLVVGQWWPETGAVATILNGTVVPDTTCSGLMLFAAADGRLLIGTLSPEVGFTAPLLFSFDLRTGQVVQQTAVSSCGDDESSTTTTVTFSAQLQEILWPCNLDVLAINSSDLQVTDTLMVSATTVVNQAIRDPQQCELVYVALSQQVIAWNQTSGTRMVLYDSSPYGGGTPQLSLDPRTSRLLEWDSPTETNSCGSEEQSVLKAVQATGWVEIQGILAVNSFFTIQQIQFDVRTREVLILACNGLFRMAGRAVSQVVAATTSNGFAYGPYVTQSGVYGISLGGMFSVTSNVLRVQGGQVESLGPPLCDDYLFAVSARPMPDGNDAFFWYCQAPVTSVAILQSSNGTIVTRHDMPHFKFSSGTVSTTGSNLLSICATFDNGRNEVITFDLDEAISTGSLEHYNTSVLPAGQGCMATGVTPHERILAITYTQLLDATEPNVNATALLNVTSVMPQSGAYFWSLVCDPLDSHVIYMSVGVDASTGGLVIFNTTSGHWTLVHARYGTPTFLQVSARDRRLFWSLVDPNAPVIVALDIDTLSIWTIWQQQGVGGLPCIAANIAFDEHRSLLWVGCTALFAVTSQLRCAPGFGFVDGVCSPCGVATFSPALPPGSGQVPLCLACAPGTIAPQTGSSVCSACSLGRYQDQTVQPLPQSCSFCQPGTSSSVLGATVCAACAAGRAAPDSGYATCEVCPPGSYTMGNRSAACLQCARGTASNATGYWSPVGCPVCQAGSEQLGFGNAICVQCALGQYSEVGVGVCQQCPVNSYSPSVAATTCLPCNDPVTQVGLICSGGFASVAGGYWAFLTPVNASQPNSLLIYHTTPCPLDYCKGGPLQVPTARLCEWPRLNSLTNWLCGACEPGYLPWGDRCVACNRVNGPIIFGLLVLCLLLVGFLHHSGGSSSGYVAILTFFVQTAALELGPVAEWLTWLQLVNLSSRSTQTCLAPLTPLEQITLTLCTPLILVTCLAAVAVVHYCLQRCGRVRLPVWLTSSFQLDRYVGTVCAIALFSYTSVATATIESLDCRQVAPSVDRVFSWPTVDCDSEEYRAFRPAVTLVLVIYVCGLPCALLCGLYWHRHRRDARQSNEGDQPMTSEPSSVLARTTRLAAADSATATFHLRWGPLVLGRSAAAWYQVPLLLLRRLGFVLVAALLAADPLRFAWFLALNLTWLLIHTQLQPFDTRQLNRLEFASGALLTYLSLVLVIARPPYTVATQLLLLALVLPLALLLMLLSMQTYRQRAAHCCRRFMPRATAKDKDTSSSRWRASPSTQPVGSQSASDSAEPIMLVAGASHYGAALLVHKDSLAAAAEEESRPAADSVRQQRRQPLLERRED